MPFPSSTTFPSSTLYPSALGPPEPLPLAPSSRHPLADLSGVVINQNQVPASVNDFSGVDGHWRYQEFILPSDYQRGSEAEEQRHPPISGFQLALGVPDADAVELEFKLERNVFGLGWLPQATGSLSGASAEGTLVWTTLYLDRPVEVDSDSSDDRWRFAFRGNADRAWLSVPNPLAVPGNVKAYASDGTTPLTFGGEQFSFMFRVLGLTADEGVDFLGNNYRSAVVEQSPGNVLTGAGSDDDTFWLSKPNPSKFAVESLYFDVRPVKDNIEQERAVIDRLTIDPITPGVYFHIYYSDEGEPGSSPETWDNKLWTRVPQTYRMMKRETHVLPEPIVAKYIKIEFSHLQAQHYVPGDFAQEVLYRKHPKWVLDYFLLRAATEEIERPIAKRVGIIWDALDLAYNYYLDDLRQEPAAPVTIDDSQVGVIRSFLRTRDDVSDQIDSVTLSKIKLAFDPFTQHPVRNTDLDFLLAQVMQGQQEVEYPVESYAAAPLDLSDVSNLRRERLIFEATYPVMFFYLTSRHAYREITASFSHNRAYFVGVREVAFTRENYTAAHDTGLYIQPTHDNVNLEYNDFVMHDGQWAVY